MRFFAVVVKKHGEEHPAVDECWSEYERDSNRRGFDEDVKAIRRRTDVESCAVVTFHLNEHWLTGVVLRQTHNAGQVEAVIGDV